MLKHDSASAASRSETTSRSSQQIGALLAKAERGHVWGKLELKLQDGMVTAAELKKSARPTDIENLL